MISFTLCIRKRDCFFALQNWCWLQTSSFKTNQYHTGVRATMTGLSERRCLWMESDLQYCGIKWWRRHLWCFWMWSNCTQRVSVKTQQIVVSFEHNRKSSILNISYATIITHFRKQNSKLILKWSAKPLLCFIQCLSWKCEKQNILRKRLEILLKDKLL